ncbi:Imidazoleglycerol-phosphate dehydratase, partial [Frankliniella fusca]
GYTSFCAGYTSRFGDIDIFIYCTKDLTEINNYDAIQRPDTVNIQKWTNNVINMLFHGYENADETLQFVQVNFDIKTEIPSDIKFLDLMMMYVLSNFDLPVCKIAMKIFDNSTYVMDLRALEGVDPKTKTERQEKYKRRTINNIKMQVPSLMTLSLRSIFKSD